MILLILGCIVFTIFCVVLGYLLAMYLYKPKELLEEIKELLYQIEEYDTMNKDLNTGIEKMDETMKSNTNWYMAQLNNLGMYLKDKYQDNYVFDQLKQVPGFEEKPKIIYDIDVILDKASKFGLDSLTEEEKNYLRKQK